MKAVLALDAGTTANTVLVVGVEGRVLARSWRAALTWAETSPGRGR